MQKWDEFGMQKEAATSNKQESLEEYFMKCVGRRCRNGRRLQKSPISAIRKYTVESFMNALVSATSCRSDGRPFQVAGQHGGFVLGGRT